MTRTALARTYRPRRFSELSMQGHVSETLRNAVAKDRVAHAYLFSGPRGVGKTSAARLLAMALNCPRRGADGEPCGGCESCERIWSGRTSLDVVEIDAASNRGVDDARDLRERAMYAPTEEGRYKVYIIDEAHMLTREAWNALLKILEEPPPRVIFIFATTEPQKIQQTAAPILSRTQRFDFRRLGVPAIVDRLAAVLAAEGVDTDEQALLLVARRAEGGMRDALSLLDQALSFTSGRLVTEDVQRILGLVADEVYLDLFAVIAEGRVGDVFRFVQDVVEGGHDLNEFYRGLADAVRTLLVIRFDGEGAAAVRDELRPLWAERAHAFSTGDLLRMLGQIADLDADGRFRKSTNPRVTLEALLLRFAHLPRTVEIEALLRAAGDPAGGAAPAPLPDSPPPPPPHPRAAPPRAPVREAMAEPSQKPALPESEPPRAQAPQQPGPELSAEQVVREIVARGSAALPSGLGLFLRSARIEEEGDGRVVVEMPAGPGRELLDESPRAQRALQDAISERLGRSVRLEVRSSAAPPAEQTRLTPERLREQQLSQLTREEPSLDRAVQEWDLEMLD
jgi:DNA polymerase III subunit gamma/tau